VPPRKERPLAFALPPVASAEDMARAIEGVLAALAQGLVTLSEAIELIERCRRIIGPALPAAALSHDIRIQFVTAAGEVRRSNAVNIYDLPLERCYELDESGHAAGGIVSGNHVGYGVIRSDPQRD
jgi:hypothetical protein